MRVLETLKKSGRMLVVPVIMLLFSLVLAGLLMLAMGNNPLLAYGALLQGAFGSLKAWVATLNKAVPICIASFAVGIGNKAGVFNIGVEGQLLIGSFGATLAGIYFTGLPSVLHIVLCILAGMLFGALWSLLPSLLYILRGTNVVVSNILLNTVAALVLNCLIVGPFAGSDVMVAATDRIQPSAELPLLVQAPYKLSSAVLIMLLVAAVLYIFIYKSTAGFELRAVGLNRSTVDYVGIPSKKYILFALLAGGMLAGLLGSLEIMGNYHMLYDKFSPGYGYDGIPIALLARGNPLVSIVGAVLFGGLRAGSQNMQMVAGVQKEVVTVIQGLLILSIAAEPMFRFAVKAAGRGRRAKGGLGHG